MVLDYLALDNFDFTRKIVKKIRRGPKLEGSAFANFGYSSETERKSRFEMGNSCGVSLKTGLVPVPPY